MTLLKEYKNYTTFEEHLIDTIGEDRFWALKNADITVVRLAGITDQSKADFIMKFPDGKERAVEWHDISVFARKLMESSKKDALNLCRSFKWTENPKRY